MQKVLNIPGAVATRCCWETRSAATSRLHKNKSGKRLRQGRLDQARDLCHTVKSHSVASSGTNSGYIDSNGSVVWGAYPILEYHSLRNSLLGCVQWRGVSSSRRIV